MPELRPGECWFDAGDGSAPSRITTVPLRYSTETGWSVNGQPVVLVVDELPQLVQTAITERFPGGSGRSATLPSLDQCSPDTSQAYFLDLIARIDDATDEP